MSTAEFSLTLDEVPIELEAALLGPTMSVSQLLALRVGAIIPTRCRIGENVAVYAGGSRIGEGELSNRGQRLLLRVVRTGSGS